MNEVYSKDLGIVTAYGYALSKGYTGTEEQFATLMASYATIGQQAVDAALAAEGYAVGTHDGEPVPSTDPAYHNNAKYYAEQLEPALDALDYALAAFPTATLTDQTIASFDDGADDIPVKDLTISIEPVQKGSSDPTPDNVRPITGWTGANIARTGKNLFNRPSTILTNYGTTLTPNNDGSFTLEGVANATPSNFNVLLPAKLPSGTKVAISLNNTDTNSSIAVRLVRPDSNRYGTPVYARETNATGVFTIPASWGFATHVNIICGTSAAGHDDISPITLKIQVELGDTATAWQPYSGTAYPVSWESEAGTVYGGTLDVTTGLLTVTRAMVDAGTLTWTKNSSITNGFNAALSPAGTFIASNPYELMCSAYKTSDPVTYVSQIADKTIIGSLSSSFRTFRLIFIRDDDYAEAWENDTPEVFKATLNGVQVSYVLTTPLTYQLTPTEVKTLLGENHIWADTGDTSVNYRADPTLYIDGKVAALTALISES